MKIPILKNTDKLCLKFHWWLFFMKSGFLHHAYNLQNILFIQNAFKNKNALIS